MEEKLYTPYTYLIGWSKLDIWYYGSRYATKSKVLYSSGCHPDEFWITYHTSSKPVTRFIELNGEPDVKEIRKIFCTVEETRIWESKVLRRLGAVKSDKWLNQTDRVSILLSKETRKQASAKASITMKGRPTKTIWTDDMKIKMSTSSKANELKWWTDGISEIKSKICPEGYKSGRKPISNETREKLSEGTKNRISVKFGPKTEEQKKNLSLKMKEHYSDKPSSRKGKIFGPNKRKRIGPSPKKGIIQEKNIECPHCKILGASLGNMNRWHFDNCKKIKSLQPF